MTIKELYELAKEKGIENLDLYIQTDVGMGAELVYGELTIHKEGEYTYVELY